MPTDEDLHKVIEECLNDDSDRLSSWEQEFLDDLVHNTDFSPKQEAVILRIWDKLFN